MERKAIAPFKIGFHKCPFIFDYKDVELYIKHNLMQHFVKILIAKVSDVIMINMKSCYESDDE
jgi:hypothetical protein